ncbi:MAG: DUF4290 domain-containing protein [Duncaniella sp.]|nr:DUF4290 domain-containing protein [Duncaniella sp.]
MLTYNTMRPRLPLPEYGRTIQKMVDHCLAIEARDERTRCAYAIVETMEKLFPKVKEHPDCRQTLWDHIVRMSGYTLDVDFPVEITGPEALEAAPGRVPYPGRFMRRRIYGKTIELMIDKAIEMPEGPERDELSLLIAEQMKKMLCAQTSDYISDARVFDDLAEYSHGLIRLSPETTMLHEYKIIAPPSGKKKKKR